MDRENLDKLTEEIIHAAIRVHKALEPGLVESAHHTCLVFELSHQGRRVQRQKPLPVVYRDVAMDGGYRLDLLVDDEVIAELKPDDRFDPVHQARILSYLKLSKKKIGLLINSNVQILTHGVRRVANHVPKSLQRPPRAQRLDAHA